MGEYEIEGVSDTLAALCGAENILTDFYEDPLAADTLTGRVTDILIEFVKWNNKEIGGRQNLLSGMTTGYGIWMPRDSCVTAEDCTVMCGNIYYQNHFKAHTQKLAQSFNKTLIEVHMEGNHQIKEFGNTYGISMMTIENLSDMDSEYRNDIKTLLGKRNFLINTHPDHMEKVLEFTGIKGIMLAIDAPSAQEAN